MHKNKKFRTQSGFGLIELMVSISIVVLVTSVIMARHDSYNGAILLRSQAYDIALKIREVQMQAVSAVGQEDDFRTPLGVCFNTDWPNYYHIFADTDAEGQEGHGECDADEYVGQRGNIDPRFRIESLDLISSVPQNKPTNIAILFERPNFDARFFVSGTERTDIDAVEIGLMRVGADAQSSSAGDLRVMEISRTGQILVQPVTVNSVVVEPVDECEEKGNCNIGGGGGDDTKGDDENGGGSIDLPPNEDDGSKGGEDLGGDGGENELPPSNPEDPKI